MIRAKSDYHIEHTFSYIVFPLQLEEPITFQAQDYGGARLLYERNEIQARGILYTMSRPGRIITLFSALPLRCFRQDPWYASSSHFRTTSLCKLPSLPIYI